MSGVSIDILVTTRASRARIGPRHDGRIKVAVTAPPVDGKANRAVAELFSRALKIARGNIEITAGASSRRKTIHIAGVSEQAVAELVA